MPRFSRKQTEPHRSLWLQQALGDEPPAAALQGAARADIAIIGGGFVGLWTALRLKEHDPSCDVVIVEQDICGGGVSGRNAGWILSWSAKIPTLQKVCGEDEALRLMRASEAVIGEIQAFAQTNAIEIDFHRDGWLWVASTPAHLGAWEETVSRCERMGITAFRRLEPEEATRRSGSAKVVGGVLDTTTALIQPAALARGLRRVALERGVRIYEGSRVVDLDRDYPVVLTTAQGRLVAEKLVIAGNAWATEFGELRRAVVVTASDIVVTEPIPQRLAALGFTGGEGVTDSRLMLDYYRATPDGRLLFGKGGAGLALGGRVGNRFDDNQQFAQVTKARLRKYFPTLADVPITNTWAGPIDRSPDGLPLFGRLGGKEHIVYGIGFSGNGVGPSVLAGRILASLALERRDEWSESPLARRPLNGFPPEPVRFLGGRVVQEAVRRKEWAEEAGRAPNPIALRLANLAPASVEDKHA